MNRNVIRMACTGSWLLFTAGCAHVRPSGDLATGKIIAWGGTPAPQFLQEHLKELDALPYDGIVFDPSNGGITHWWYLDLGRTWRPDEFRSGIAIMKSLPLQHLRHNFARLNTCSIRADWFDDQAWA